MKERPIPFSAPMVRALLAGTKTQTRRAVKLPSNLHPDFGGRAPLMLALDDEGIDLYLHSRVLHKAVRCPYGHPGDRLWVREAWTTHKFMDAIPPRDLQTISIAYVADGKIETGKYRQGFHMPRRYSRITLEVTGVRVERLQAISEADAIAEGVDRFPGCRRDDDTAAFNRIGPVDNDSFPIARYAALWEAINGPGSWEANPFVWVVAFKRVEVAAS